MSYENKKIPNRLCVFRQTTGAARGRERVPPPRSRPAVDVDSNQQAMRGPAASQRCVADAAATCVFPTVSSETKSNQLRFACYGGENWEFGSEMRISPRHEALRNATCPLAPTRPIFFWPFRINLRTWLGPLRSRCSRTRRADSQEIFLTGGDDWTLAIHPPAWMSCLSSDSSLGLSCGHGQKDNLSCSLQSSLITAAIHHGLNFTVSSTVFYDCIPVPPGG